jgi:hypothetical protein
VSSNNIADELVAQLDNGVNAVAEKPDLKSTEDESIDIKEAQVGGEIEVEDHKEFRSELVCKEDIVKVLEYDKVELQKYAHSRLGKEIDLSKRIKQLRTEVVLLIQKKLDLPTDTDSSAVKTKQALISKNPEFIFNPKMRRIFEWTELLSKRTDLIPCHVVDLEGKRL